MNSKFSDRERADILAQVRNTLQRAEAGEPQLAQAPAPLHDEPHEDALAAAMRQPIPDPLDQWRADAEEQERRFASAREKRRRSAEPAPTNWDLRIAEAIADERQHVLTVVGEALGEMWAEQRKDASDLLHDEVRTLRMELLELQTTLCELRQVVASAGNSNKIVDLPNPLRNRVN